MEATEYDIEFPRGDTCPLVFDITDEEGNSLNMSTSTDEIYFTFKKSYTTSEYILQKKWSTGEIELDGTQASVVLEHEDTAELSYGNYVYDIQFKSGSYVKTLALGQVKLTNESTHLGNE